LRVFIHISDLFAAFVLEMIPQPVCCRKTAKLFSDFLNNISTMRCF